MMTQMNTSSVAVVILNWNGRHHLETYLPSVVAQTSSEHVIWVADNGSSDDSVSWLREHHSEVKVLELGQNWGFAEGYNQALAHIDADVYVLLNSDVRVEGPWVEPVLAVMEAESWSVASPLIRQDLAPSLCEHAGAAGGWMDKDGYPFCLGRMFQTVETVDDWLMQNREVFWASGACFFIRKSAWLEANGFDGSLFAHMEEIDLCWRLKNRGHRVGCAGTVSVRHLGGGTLSTFSPFKTYLNFRNNLIVMLKNRPGCWPTFMFRRMTLDGIAAWRMLASGQWRQFLAVGKAHGAFYLRLPATLKVRKSLKDAPSKPRNDKGWWRHSVVWAHFAKGQTKARDLDLPGLG